MVFKLLQEQEMYTNTIHGDKRIYNESDLPQSEQKYFFGNVNLLQLLHF